MSKQRIILLLLWLGCLAQAHVWGHRILDKEFLHRTLWPDTFVEDGTLTQYVFLLRKALQEDPAGHRYIETVPRRGYRFVASVQEVAGRKPSAEGETLQRNGTPSFGATKNGNYGVPQALTAPPEPAVSRPAINANWLSFPSQVDDVVLMSDFLPT